jgi:hypothetical protein
MPKHTHTKTVDVKVTEIHIRESWPTQPKPIKN